MKKFTIWMFVCVFVLLCSSTSVFAEISKVPKINDVYVIHFVLDGLNKKTFEKAVSEGKFPTVKKLFFDEGAYFSQATSLFPSTSSTIYQGYATGLFSGRSGISHLERFDRRSKKEIDYLTASGHDMINSDMINFKSLINPDDGRIEPPTTIFELLNDYPTAAIYSMFYRGASLVHPKIAPIAALWSAYIAGNEERLDLLAMRRVKGLFRGKIETVPRYTLVGLYSTDFLGHKYGPNSDELNPIFTQFDIFLKEFVALLEKRGIRQKTYIILSADHGMHESGDLFELAKAFKEEGIFIKPADPRVKNYDIFAANRGVSSSHIYVGRDGEFKPVDDPEVYKKVRASEGKEIDLPKFLTSLEATDLVIARAGMDKVLLYSQNGENAEISCYVVQSEDFCSYKFDKAKKDPLGFSDKPSPSLLKLIDGKPHSSRDWLLATADKNYPDGVIQLSQVFWDGRAGDIFVTTREKYGFRKVKTGNHGGATEDDMRVPLMISGPKIEKVKDGHARPVDVYPMLLEWFGLNVDPKNYDGVSPLKEDAKIKFFDLAQKLAEYEDTLKKGESISKLHSGDRKKLLEFANKELADRQKTLGNLSKLSGELNLQKKDKNAPKICAPSYLADHIDIVERTKTWAESRVDRMLKIAARVKK